MSDLQSGVIALILDQTFESSRIVMTAKDVAQGRVQKNPRSERLTSYSSYVVLPELRLPITKIVLAHG